ncbi:hypothetical protein G7B40_001540 [Aetokthonos hydrillicola Thurmond2011]|uniref:Uncharacterized protein n=2 Tax=Aetokthonos TaxID=1550243 RepID=A0AAP5M8H4_9CYAN|nr:hypothetical protein [Aetokthonos hydrillicola]MDR9893269.1 hypothetical protein [Aetokthonos hydrillicola Thurmond2011]
MFHEIDDYTDNQLSREQKEFIVGQVATQIDRLSLKKLALISEQPTRQNKIKYIENELYRRSMNEDTSTEDLVKIHEALVWSETEQTKTAIRDENSLNAWFNRLVHLGFSILALATISSYLGVKVCGDNRSYFCLSMHRIPNFLNAVFQEPPKHKSFILPLPENQK